MSNYKGVLPISSALKIFENCCPEFFITNSVEIFQQFSCPISIIEADVSEYLIDEYDSVELLILRLFSIGIRSSNQINELTGIDTNTIDKILDNEKYTYGHIDPNTLNLTEFGEKTLQCNTNIDEIKKHALYKQKRVIHADALTGSIIKAEAELKLSEMELFNESIDPIILPRDTILMDEELEAELKERLSQYIAHDYLSDSKSLYSIDKLNTREVRYRLSYFVKMRNFDFPFVAMQYKITDGIKLQTTISPISVSQSDLTKFSYNEKKCNYMYRDDHYFEYLKEKEEYFNAKL